MGFLNFLFGKTEIIWTLDVYIDAITSSPGGYESNREETGKKIRVWGDEILATYGLIGIEHVWRAAVLSSDSEALTGILRREWKSIPGWKRGA
jgi:hypothetical protein